MPINFGFNRVAVLLGYLIAVRRESPRCRLLREKPVFVELLLKRPERFDGQAAVKRIARVVALQKAITQWRKILPAAANVDAEELCAQIRRNTDVMSDGCAR